MIGAILEIILNVVLPVGACASVGFVWARMKQPFDKGMVTRLVSNVGVPCLVFTTLTGVELDLNEFFGMGAAALVSNLLFFVMGWGILKLAGWPIRTYLNPIAFANVGNMGLPLCLLAFGEAGLALGIAYFVVNVILLVTVGIAIASARYRPQDVLRQPFIYAAAASIFFLLSDFEVPQALASTAKLLGNFSIPLMLITLGYSLATLKIDSFARSIGIALLRLVIGLCVGFGVATAFGFEGPAYGIFVVMCSMPVAVITYLFAETYGADGRAVAGAVVVSTLLSFVTLPVLLWFLIH